MKLRAVRIPLVDAVVAFDGRPVRLVNISRTGALVRFASPPDVGRDGSLTVSHAHTSIRIDGRIVRVGIAADPDGDDDSARNAALPADEMAWQAAIAFTAPPPEEITALLRRIVAPRRPATEPLRV